MILQTPVNINPINNKISYKDNLMFMGSCFANEIGTILKNLEFNILVNPFGVLYNPSSIKSSIDRLADCRLFTTDDIIESSNLYTSFFHHSSFSRSSAKEFLSNANNSLIEASSHFNAAKFCIITLGTAWVYKHIAKDYIVSNCHKIVASEFERFRLSGEEIEEMLSSIVERFPSKNWIFTVSPIRHLKDGAHENQLSKATLLLAIDKIIQKYPNAHYFPAYEIMLDELRDYRFYCENMTHPTQQAIKYIFERFCEFAIDPTEKAEMKMAEKRYKTSQHIPLKNRKS